MLPTDESVEGGEMRLHPNINLTYGPATGANYSFRDIIAYAPRMLQLGFRVAF